MNKSWLILFLSVYIGHGQDVGNKTQVANKVIKVYYNKGQTLPVQIGRVPINHKNIKLEDKSFMAEKTSPSDYFDVDSDGMISMVKVVEGQHDLEFLVFDRMYSNTVTEKVSVIVEELNDLVVHDSASIRLSGITAQDFIQPSKLDSFRTAMGQTGQKHGLILFGVTTKQQSPAIIEVRFGVAFPFRQSECWVKHENYSKLGQDFGFTVSEVSADHCVLKVKPKPVVVDTNNASFVGIDVECNPEPKSIISYNSELNKARYKTDPIDKRQMIGSLFIGYQPFAKITVYRDDKEIYSRINATSQKSFSLRKANMLSTFMMETSKNTLVQFISVGIRQNLLDETGHSYSNNISGVYEYVVEEPNGEQIRSKQIVLSDHIELKVEGENGYRVKLQPHNKVILVCKFETPGHTLDGLTIYRDQGEIFKYFTAEKNPEMCSLGGDRLEMDSIFDDERASVTVSDNRAVITINYLGDLAGVYHAQISYRVPGSSEPLKLNSRKLYLSLIN